MHALQLQKLSEAGMAAYRRHLLISAYEETLLARAQKLSGSAMCTCAQHGVRQQQSCCRWSCDKHDLCLLPVQL